METIRKQLVSYKQPSDVSLAQCVLCVLGLFFFTKLVCTAHTIRFPTCSWIKTESYMSSLSILSGGSYWKAIGNPLEPSEVGLVKCILQCFWPFLGAKLVRTECIFGHHTWLWVKIDSPGPTPSALNRQKQCPSIFHHFSAFLGSVVKSG